MPTARSGLMLAMLSFPGRFTRRQDHGNSAAALILIEHHHWAVPLRNAVVRAGGFRISDGFISPLDLVSIGLMAAEEAKELHDLETSSAAPSKS